MRKEEKAQFCGGISYCCDGCSAECKMNMSHLSSVKKWFLKMILFKEGYVYGKQRIKLITSILISPELFDLKLIDTWELQGIKYRKYLYDL